MMNFLVHIPGVHECISVNEFQLKEILKEHPDAEVWGSEILDREKYDLPANDWKGK